MQVKYSHVTRSTRHIQKSTRAETQVEIQSLKVYPYYGKAKAKQIKEQQKRSKECAAKDQRIFSLLRSVLLVVGRP